MLLEIRHNTLPRLRSGTVADTATERFAYTASVDRAKEQREGERYYICSSQSG